MGDGHRKCSSCEQESRHQGDASASQEIPKIVANHQEWGERQRTNFPALGGAKPAKTSDSDFQPLELRQEISAV